MLRATVVVFALAVAAGGYLMWRGGWPIILIGVLSILFGILYTAGRYALAYLGIADLFVLVFFGPVAVGGTYYVQALHVTPVVLAAGLAPGLIAVALLLTNNIRDVEEDAAAGKKTLVVRMGRRAAVVFYGICLIAAICLPVVLFLLTGSHPLAMATLVLLPMAAGMIRRVAHTHGAALNPLLGATSRLLLHYSLIFSIGWNL
jgi:1,4-dihydroxy-2-naphthoate octaprenyltransferase